MYSEREFFQLAATLIPVLILASSLTNALRPPSRTTAIRGRHMLALLVFYAAIGLMLLAEVSAITSTFTGNSTTVDRIIVPLGLYLALATTAYSLLYPWAQRLILAGGHNAKTARGLVVITALSIVVFVAQSAFSQTRLFGLTDALPSDQPLSGVFEVGAAQRSVTAAQVELLRAERRAEAEGKVSNHERDELRLLRSDLRFAETMKDAMLRAYRGGVLDD